MSRGSLPINIVYTGGLDGDARLRAAVEEAQDKELERILNMVIKSNEETKAELAEMKALLKEKG
jgi:hypothetical protein